MTCEKDMGTILPKLQNIYGLQRPNRRVLWQNPTHESRTT